MDTIGSDVRKKAELWYNKYKLNDSENELLR